MEKLTKKERKLFEILLKSYEAQRDLQEICPSFSEKDEFGFNINTAIKNIKNRLKKAKL